MLDGQGSEGFWEAQMGLGDHQGPALSLRSRGTSWCRVLSSGTRSKGAALLMDG